ncbi:MAG: YkgJ family cysteine cluster protein [Planctomycetes bacterium]|nr:YkgJ family cysteine cluster protein [Planctomycetota bacterium]
MSFYDEGLHFECVQDCSRCCGGGPGYVWLSEEDVAAISDFLGMSTEAFKVTYTKECLDELSLKDIEEDNWNCVMLKEGRCMIYAVRPIQCRTYPFWSSNIESALSWKREKKHCPGIGQGKLYAREDIEEISANRRTIDSVK